MEFLFLITSGGFNWLPICNISYRRFELLFSSPFPVGESPLFHHNLLPFLMVVVFCFPFRVFESPLPPLGGTCRGATCRGAARRCAGLASGCGGVVPLGLGGSSHVIPALACAMAGIYGCGVLFLRAQKYKETVYTDMEGRISTIILLSPSFQFGHQAWNRNA